MTDPNADFAEGYLDGRDPDAPEPSANRSHAYRHSFEIGRAEIAGQPIPYRRSIAAAALAIKRDAEA